MISTLVLHTDIDECSEGVSGCSQLCSNTVGSYRCSCQNGYQLGSDNHTCLGNIINALLMIDIAYDGQISMNVQVKVEDVNKIVKTLLVAILVLV